MHGKFDSSQSKSTSFVRVLIAAFIVDRVAPELFLDRDVDGRRRRCNIHGLSGRFAFFAPRLQCVVSWGHILDGEISVFVGDRKIRGRHDHDIARHFRMHIAKKRCYAEVVELECFLLTLRPGAHVVRELLVSTDRRPINVVTDGIAVRKSTVVPSGRPRRAGRTSFSFGR